MNVYSIKTMLIILSCGFVLSACEKAEEGEKELILDTQRAKSSYAVGVSQGEAMKRNLDSLDGTEITLDTEIMIRAYKDGLEGTSVMDKEALDGVMNGFRDQVNIAMQAKRQSEQEDQAKAAEENLALGLQFLADNKTKEGVVALESGLQYKVLEAGSGKSPKETDRVEVHYTGTLIDGTQFDSSRDRGQPATFGVNQVIKGWTEALQSMKEGGRWQLFIPSELAYGAMPRPTIPGNSVLVFDVELIKVLEDTSDASAEAK